eukprot:gene5743-6646_t
MIGNLKDLSLFRGTLYCNNPECSLNVTLTGSTATQYCNGALCSLNVTLTGSTATQYCNGAYCSLNVTLTAPYGQPNNITIQGSRFSNIGLSASIGDSRCESVTYLDPWNIICQFSGKGAKGPTFLKLIVNVTANGLNGAKALYQYQNISPSLLSVDVKQAPSGILFTLSGVFNTGSRYNTAVFANGIECNINSFTDTTITCTTKIIDEPFIEFNVKLTDQSIELSATATYMQSYPIATSIDPIDSSSKTVSIYGYFEYGVVNVTLNGEDCHIISNSRTHINCSIPSPVNPGYATVIINVGGYTFESNSTLYISNVNVTDICKATSNNCNGNGTCINGYCSCNQGYGGFYCQSVRPGASCGPDKANTLPVNADNLDFLQVVHDGVTFYGHFLPIALSNGRPTYSRNEIINQTETTQLIGLNLPQCQQCIIDPDFSILVEDTNNNDKCAVGKSNKWLVPVIVVVCVVGVAVLGAATALFLSKKKYQLKMVKLKLFGHKH